jgi:DNA-binding transcriptional regulator YdaS (Cro superfamily)
MVSKRFKEAVRAWRPKQYELAHRAGIHPVTLSQMVTGYIRPKFNDPRVLKVAKIIGLSPSECFLKEARNDG